MTSSFLTHVGERSVPLPTACETGERGFTLSNVDTKGRLGRLVRCRMRRSVSFRVQLNRDSGDFCHQGQL
jgi:hypothetical protein